MATNGQNFLVMLVQRREWEQFYSSMSMTNNAAIAGQNLKIYNGDIAGDERVGYAQAFHSGADFLSMTGVADKHLMDKWGTRADYVAIAITFYNVANDERELSTAGNSLTMGDMLTVGGTIAATFTKGAVLAYGGVVFNAAGIAYTLFQSVDGHNQWTWDYLNYGYERTIMSGFINNLWVDNDQIAYKHTIKESGGAQTLKWIMAAIEGENTLVTYNQVINDVHPNNYRDKALNYIYLPEEQGGAGIRIATANQVDVLNESRKYHLSFIRQSPDELYEFLKLEQDRGNADTVTAYLNALKNVNPVVVHNPRKFQHEPMTLEDVSEEWIKARTWLIMEMRTKLGIQYYQDAHVIGGEVNESDAKDLEKNPDIYNLPQNEDYFKQHIANTLRVRESYGFGKDAHIRFVNHGKFFEFDNGKEGDVHNVVFMDSSYTAHYKVRNTNGDIVIGDAGDNVITGDWGDDVLYGGKGNDRLDGSLGFDKLDGGEGNDTYAFYNTAEMRGIITDSDGQGQITLFGKPLSKAVQFERVAPGSDVWQGEYQGEILRAVLDPKGNLHITSSTSKADLLIEGWRDMGHDKLGIVLGEFNDKAPGDGYTLIEGDWRTRVIGAEVHQDVADSLQFTYEDRWNERNANGAIINPYGVYQKDFDDIMFAGGHKTIAHGRGGNDAIQGSAEKDRIYGESGSDLLAGNGGADIIDGGDGDDFIFADARLTFDVRQQQSATWQPSEKYQQILFSGTKWGVYRGQSGAIIHDGVERIDIFDKPSNEEGTNLYGGSGSDHIFGSNRNDFISGDLDTQEAHVDKDAGNDLIFGLGGMDTIHGDNGNDIILGDGNTSGGILGVTEESQHGSDTLYGGGGNDSIYGGGGDDTIHGGTDNDSLYGDEGDRIDHSNQLLSNKAHGKDKIFGEDGDDYIVGGGKEDELYGGNGSDRIWGDYHRSNNYTEDDGDDKIYGDAGNDFLFGGGGSDHIWGGDDKDQIIGGTGNDKIFGDAGDDVIWGDDDQGNTTKDHGMDTVYGGTGNDVIFGNGNTDWLYGEDGNDKLQGNQGGDFLFGGNGHDVLWGQEDNDELHGGAGNDKLYGDDNKTATLAQHGQDTLYGDEGNDVLVGHGDRDELYGGDGDDQLFGEDVAYPSQHDPAYNTSANARRGDYLEGGKGNDYLDGGFGGDALLGGEGHDYLWGGSGKDYLYGEDGNDEISGDIDQPDKLDPQENHDDTIDAGAGNDKVSGGAGGDTIWGGSGNDVIHGDNLINERDESQVIGNDIIYGGYGMDYLYGDGGNDTLYGDDGDDHLLGGSGNDVLQGGEGDDYLHGGKGTDYLFGGLGTDYYYFARGDGETYIDDPFGASLLTLDSFANIRLGTYAEGMVLYNGIEGDAVYLKGYFPHDTEHSLPWNNLLLQAADTGQRMTLGNALLQQLQQQGGNGSDADDVLTGTENDDFFFAGDGDDLLFAAGGNDAVDGGNGDDVLHGGEGNDTVYGKAGDDVLHGDGGDDRLSGGAGSDHLHGDAGRDVFIFDVLEATSFDTIYDSTAGEDKIALQREVFTGLQFWVKEENFAFGKTATTAEQRLLLDKTDGKLYYDADGNGDAAAIHIATLQNSALEQINHSSFTLI